MTESLFLQALSMGIAHSLWQGGMLWLAYYSWVSLAKPSSEKRYFAAAAMVLVQVFAFAFTVGINWLEIAGRKELAFTGGIINSNQPWWAYVQEASVYISSIYLLAVGMLSIRLAAGRRRLQQWLVNDVQKAPLDWRLFVRHHAALLHIKRQVKVYLSPYIQSPLTAGFWKPVILMPVAAVNQLSMQQAEAILLHELVHIRRHDYLVNLLLQWAGIIFFYHPFVRLMLKEAEQQREHSCDDWVLQFRFNALDYSKALLLLQQQPLKPVVAMGASNQGNFVLLHRIRRILQQEQQTLHRADTRWALPLAVAMLLAAFAGKPLIQKHRKAYQANMASSSRLPLYDYRKGFASARINRMLPLTTDLLLLKGWPAADYNKATVADEVWEKGGEVVDQSTSNALSAAAMLRQAQSINPLVLNMSTPSAQMARPAAFDEAEGMAIEAKLLLDQEEKIAEAQEKLEEAKDAAMLDKLAEMDAQASKLGAKLESMNQQQLLNLQEELIKIEMAEQALLQKQAARQQKQAFAGHQFSYNAGHPASKTKGAVSVSPPTSPMETLAKGKINSIDADRMVQSLVVSLLELANNPELEPALKYQMGQAIIQEFNRSDYARNLQVSAPDDYKQLMKYLRSKAPKRVEKF